jgi:hypothetical protein
MIIEEYVEPVVAIENAIYQKRGIAHQDKHKTVFIPRNFDITRHLDQNPPKGFRPSVDRIAYIVSQIIERPLFDKPIYKNFKSEDYPYVSLSSQYLKAKIHNYENYLSYLIDTGVIESNNRYEVGEFSKGYRFTNNYRSLIAVQTVTDPKLVNDHLSKRGNQEAKRKYSHLISWFDDLLIDKQAALSYIESSLHKQLTGDQSKDTKIILKHNNYILMVTKVYDKDFFFTLDQYSNRFHSILTNIKSDLRNFLKYKDKELISLDLSGSQPFLILNLLTSNFYTSKIKSKHVTFENINFDINPLLIFPERVQSIDSIMCGSFKKSQSIKEIKFYKHLVKHNQFYEYCREKFSELDEDQQVISRSTVKKIVLSVIFASNDEPNPYVQQNKRIFKKVFPFIYSVLEAWKSSQGNNLAKVLQKIESFLFLDCIAARLNDERPDLPIYTVHDSIVTLAGEEGYVLKVMNDEIRIRTGYNPHFKIELWNEANLK